MYAELSLCCPLQPGMVTQESRGNETAVAFRPSAGMCTRIIVSVELVTCVGGGQLLELGRGGVGPVVAADQQDVRVPAVDVVVGRADRVDPVDLRGEVAVEEPHHAAGEQHEHRQERRRHAQRATSGECRRCRAARPDARPGAGHVVAGRPVGPVRAARVELGGQRHRRRGSHRGRPGPGRPGSRRRRGVAGRAAGPPGSRRAGPGRAETGRAGPHRAAAWVAGHGAGRTPAADRPSDRSLCAHRSATHLVSVPPPHARGTSTPADVHDPGMLPVLLSVTRVRGRA